MSRKKGEGLIPAKGPLGIGVVSMDFFLPKDEAPVIWRGPMKAVAIRQLLACVEWGDLDFLIIDLPPGTGDEPLSIVQLIPNIDGVLMITAPSEVSQMVVKRAIGFTRELRVPLIGLVENMSGFVCPKCGAKTDIFGSGGGRKISKDLGVNFLGKIPFDHKIVKDSDRGTPFITEHLDTPAAQAFMQVVEKVEKYLEQRGAQA
jgi:ATP-binding protein involved in chromosome partitioning